jgi:hypothetical protein
MKLEVKAFLLGAGIVALAATLFIFRDSLFTRQASIEILDPITDQTRTFEGSGTMQIVIQYPQITTDWSRRFEIYAYRKLVSNGHFRIPARFFRYVERPSCMEAGCIAHFTFQRRDTPSGDDFYCYSLDFAHKGRKDKNAVVIRCD